MSERRYVVVGGGIVGLATARELSRRHPGASVTVLEKEAEVGLHQTSHNSGVVHAGLYYPAGSLKAELCTRGRRLLKEFCADHGLPYQECGKLVVARHEGELERLAAIEQRARANGVPGLRRLDRHGLTEVEPYAAGVAALHSPHTAITDFAAIARAFAAGLDVRTGFEVASFQGGGGGGGGGGGSSGAGGSSGSGSGGGGGGVTIGGMAGQEVTADRVVICGGLHSDVLARLAGVKSGPSIVPFRGEYWRLVPDKAAHVRGLIYPVPDPRYPFLGVHFTRRVDGQVDLGPNAVLGLSREGYRRQDIDPRWIAGTVRDRAFWAMAATNWRAGVHELAGSLSRRVFVSRAASLVPGITAADVERAPAGVRAQAVEADGGLVDDFRLARVGADARIVAVINAPSPAATSCLAIAEHICDSMAA